jgi:hypothetical protein
VRARAFLPVALALIVVPLASCSRRAASRPVVAPPTAAPAPVAVAPTSTPPAPTAAPASPILRIPQLYAERDAYLGQPRQTTAGRPRELGQLVTVAGFLYEDGPTYLLDDPSLAHTRQPIPIRALLVLLGSPPPPENARGPGGMVAVGRLQRYDGRYPQYIDDNGQFLQLLAEGYPGANGGATPTPAPEPTQPADYLKQRVARGERRLYVMIIAGSPYTVPGLDVTILYHSEFWNDCLFAYQTAVRNGAEDITVFSGNGTAPPLPFPGRLPGTIPSLAAATRANVGTALINAGYFLPDGSELWIIITDHGFGSNMARMPTPEAKEHYLIGVGRVDGAPADDLFKLGDPFPGDENAVEYKGVGNSVNADAGDYVDEGVVLHKGLMLDEELGADLNDLRELLDARGVNPEVYVAADTCYSGGLIADVMYRPRACDGFAASSSEDRVSVSTNGFGAFLYYFLGALNQADPWGRPLPKRLDGSAPPAASVTWEAAFEYARALDTKESPQWKQ